MIEKNFAGKNSESREAQPQDEALARETQTAIGMYSTISRK